jgi:hypothetical protein
VDYCPARQRGAVCPTIAHGMSKLAARMLELQYPSGADHGYAHEIGFAFTAADTTAIRSIALYRHSRCSYGRESVCSRTCISGSGAVTLGLWLASSS